MRRGEVILVRVPHPSGARGKRRPAVVVQADPYLSTLITYVVAEVTTNLSMANDPACLYIDLGTPDGLATGLISDSVVTALSLATIYSHSVAKRLGELSPALLSRLDLCLKAALGIN